MSEMSMRRALVRWGWPAAIVASALAVVVMTLLQVQGPLRALVVVWFLTVCPGMAWTRVVGFADVATRWTIAIAASVSLEVVLAAGMAYARVFSPTWGLGVVVGVAVLGAIADALKAEGDMIGSAGQQRLEADFFDRFMIAATPVADQQLVAKVLDAVDDAIRRTDQLIDKLGRMKQGLLHDLLTRGTDENRELRDCERRRERFKDSLIGRIPTEWEAVQLGDLLDGIDAGKSFKCPNRSAGTGEWGVLKVSAVKPEGFDPRENKVLPSPALADPRHGVHDGDLLMTRASTYELVGLACIVEAPPERLLLSDKTLRLRTILSVNRQYVLAALVSPQVREQIQVHATGTSGSMKNISQLEISRVVLPLPPRDEQDRFVSLTAAMRSRIQAERAYREKLCLMKAGLMDDLLTGRVRVAKLLEGHRRMSGGPEFVEVEEPLVDQLVLMDRSRVSVRGAGSGSRL